ncbi:MAG: TldD/PmbA family protein [Candidatus Omnitrophica bacterium]|nr:TldD/PmbA family protein [Candidatus Omnitrophota bacterium]
MKELMDEALNSASRPGVDYADIRIIRKRDQQFAVKSGRIGSLVDDDDAGFGVRVLYRGAWGFSASSRLKRSEVRRVTDEAVRIAKVSARGLRARVKLSREAVVCDRWDSPVLQDPFTVPPGEKLNILFEIDRLLRKDKHIKVAESGMSFSREEKWFATSEGTRIVQTVTRSGAGYSATAVGNGDCQTRSFPSSHGGQQGTSGFELVRALGLVENAERIRDEAVALLKAPHCPSGELDLILDGSQIALQIHESCGHPSELDRVLGMEANYAGTSFLTVDKVNHFRYGSAMVNLVADTTVPGGLATCGYDDDGVRAQRWPIVESGILKGYHTNREVASAWGVRSRGCSRAQGWGFIPMVRITNLSLMAGEGTLEDIIRDTRRGLLFQTNKSWSIDSRRLNFQFGCEIGFEIKNGRRTRLIKNPSYQGVTPLFWGSCDRIAGPQAWRLWGVGNCGKGQPGQTFGMSHGASPARFQKVRVGIHRA